MSNNEKSLFILEALKKLKSMIGFSHALDEKAFDFLIFQDFFKIFISDWDCSSYHKSYLPSSYNGYHINYIFYIFEKLNRIYFYILGNKAFNGTLEDFSTLSTSQKISIFYEILNELLIYAWGLNNVNLLKSNIIYTPCLDARFPYGANEFPFIGHIRANRHYHGYFLGTPFRLSTAFFYESDLKFNLFYNGFVYSFWCSINGPNNPFFIRFGKIPLINGITPNFIEPPFYSPYYLSNLISFGFSNHINRLTIFNSYRNLIASFFRYSLSSVDRVTISNRADTAEFINSITNIYIAYT